MRDKAAQLVTHFRLWSKRSTELRLLKLGGSLLDMEDLACRLRHWLAQEPAVANVLIVGGGRAADDVRERNHSQGLNEAAAHWQAIEAMERNARHLVMMLPEARWLERIDEVRRFNGSLAMLNPMSFMLHDDPGHPRGALPVGWHVTSDSIAARMADMAQASELVLLKSASPPDRATCEQLVAAGYVDEFFPKASGGISQVRFVNLREATFSER